jgi:hypothetical protein
MFLAFLAAMPALLLLARRHDREIGVLEISRENFL